MHLHLMPCANTCKFYVVTLLNRTPVGEKCMATLVFKNEHKKDTCWNERGLWCSSAWSNACALVKTYGKASTITSRNRESMCNWIFEEFTFLTLILQLEMTILKVHDCWLDKAIPNPMIIIHGVELCTTRPHHTP